MQIEQFHSFHFSFSDVCPTRAQIEEMLKITDSDTALPVNTAVNEILPFLSENKDITGGFTILNAEKINLETGKMVEAYMRNANFYALFLCTAGEIFSELTKKYNDEGNYLEGYITDVLGSLTVENAMDKVQETLEQQATAEGMKITNRYSPGYCNWDVSGQKELFSLIGDNPVEISLSKSCLMIPIKSVSGIIGIGENVKKQAYKCDICNNKECIYRRIK
jgi:Vitamin B12 dependent methionine synthase, activation domain.